jgi:phosphoesterase RecJ-like protein
MELDPRIGEILNKSSTYLIICSPPDEDALASLLIMKHILESKGKKVRAISQRSVSELFSFVPFVNEVEIADPVGFDYSGIECIIAVDAGALSRIVGQKDAATFAFPQHIPVISIDHHEGNTKFTDLMIYDEHASSTVELIYQYFIHPLDETQGYMTYSLSSDEAMLLLFGLIGETRNFKWSMSKHVFFIAQKLIDAGADNYFLINNMHFNRKRDLHTFICYAAPKIEFFDDVHATLLLLTQEDIQKMGIDFSSKDDYTTHFHQMFSGVYAGYPLSGILIEYPDSISGSFRANSYENKIDLPTLLQMVTPIAGGHKDASGMTVTGKNITEVKEAVLQALRSYVS